MKHRHIKFPLLATALLATCILPVRAQQSPESAVQRSIRTFQSLLTNLQQFYVDTLDIDRHLHAGVNVMLQSLDPYTEYYTEEEAEKFHSDANGEIGGIGVRIATYDGQAYFTNPMPGRPAYEAGIRSGDKVIKVDTISTRGRDSNFVTKLVRGQAGTPVSITVVRPYAADSVITMTMNRANFTIPAVPYYAILPSGIGYIQLNTFSPDNTAEQVRRVLEEFKRDKNLKGIILDLSDNGGGLLTQAVDIASMFLPRGSKILETKGRKEGISTTYVTKKEPIFPTLPLAVIINSGSASASEVLAGALQDYDRAVLVGERSFGKGLVQSTLPMPFDAMLKVTTAKYYIPSGRLIQALDYSHRDEQGHPGYTPDSLARTYYTAAGRPVKDGGGLQPEVAVTDTIAHYYLLYNLTRHPYIFDYANRYAATHPQQQPFVMTDAVWNDFVQTLPPAALDYESGTTRAFNMLRKAAREDNLLTDQAAAQLDSLAKTLRPDPTQELNAARSEIERMLVPMIAERYGFEQAEIAATLNYDPALKKAIEIILDPSRYKALLSKKK